MTTDSIQKERIGANGDILQITLNRPPANAIDMATSRALGNAYAAARDDAAIRAVIFATAGERFFSAGWDLKAAAGGEAVDCDYGVGGFGGLQELPDMNKPVIAAVSGMAVGGGFEMALACDIIIASRAARFCLPEINAGTLADAATIKLPRRIPHHIAMDMLFTGRWMESQEALSRGLICELTEEANLLPRATAIAESLAAGPPLVFAAIKETLRETGHLPFQQAMDKVTQRRLPTVDKLYASEDHKEGQVAFTEKRPPKWRGV